MENDWTVGLVKLSELQKELETEREKL